MKNKGRFGESDPNQAEPSGSASQAAYGGSVTYDNAGYSYDPYANYDAKFKSVAQRPQQVFQASALTSHQEIVRRQELSNEDPVAVALPPHLFIPDDAQSVDIRNLANIPAGTSVDLLTFKGKAGGLVKFLGYSLFTDAVLFNNVEWIPLVNGARVLPFHGYPTQNFRMSLSLGFDLSSLIACQLDLQPQDTLVWRFINNGIVDVAAGVRMSGYYSQSTIRKTGRFGG